MIGKVRLLPLMILIAGLVFGMRVTGLWQVADNAGSGFQTAMAQDNDDDSVPRDQRSDEDIEGEPQLFTRAEVDMLQNLQTRREQLDARANEIKLQEDLLKVTEKRIEEKILELKKIEATIQELLKKHDEQEERKIRRLVKMYETMKPKDAARIFEKLDMNILIPVVERMSERRMAPIMAAMQSDAAKKLTTTLSTRKKLPKTGG